MVVWLAFMLMEKNQVAPIFFPQDFTSYFSETNDLHWYYFGIYANNQVDTQLDLAAIETHYPLSTNVSDSCCSTKVLAKWCGCLYNASLYLIMSLNKILPNYLSCTAEYIFKNSSLIHKIRLQYPFPPLLPVSSYFPSPLSTPSLFPSRKDQASQG